MLSLRLWLSLMLVELPIGNSYRLIATRGGEQAMFGEILNPVKQPRYDMTLNDVRRKDLNNRNALEDESHRWPGGVVPYVFGNITQEAKQAVIDAIADFDNFTCIKWIPRTTEENYVLFVKQVRCDSHLGRVGGPQTLSLGDGCQYKPTAIHEMMHAIGFDHEHNSINRDKYVKIHWENIRKEYEFAYFKADGVKADKTKIFDVPYCYTSIMHYSLTSFSIDEQKPTISLLADVDSSIVGQRKGFSDCDILKISKYYQCSGKDSLAPEVKPTCQPEGEAALMDGEEKTFGSIVFKCFPALNGSWSLKPIACIDNNGKRRSPGDTWNNDRFIEKCVSTETGGLKVTIGGCVELSGASRAKNDKWADGGYVRQCVQLDDSSWTISYAGCVSPDGEFRVKGDKWDDDSFVVQCTIGDPNGGIMPVGCITPSKERKDPGGKWTEGRYVYQCVNVLNGTSVSARLTGCIAKNGTQYNLGESWPDGDKEYGYEYQCQKTAEGVSISAVACAYNPGSGWVTVPQGCYKKIPGRTSGSSLYVSCKKSSSGGPEFGPISSKFPTGAEYSYQCSAKQSLAPDVKPTCQPDGEPDMKDGEEKTFDSFVLKCFAALNGSWSMKPVACIDYNSKRRSPGDTWTNDWKLEKCVSPGTGEMTISTVGCVDLSGKHRAKNGKWPEGKYVRQCVQNADNSWMITVAGCVSPDGTFRVNGDKWDTDSFVMQCTVDEPGSVGFRAVGCLSPTKERKDPGGIWTEGRYVYQCVNILNGTNVQAKEVGYLAKNGTQYNLGDTWTEGFYTFKLESTVSDGVTVRITGCVDELGNLVERTTSGPRETMCFNVRKLMKQVGVFQQLVAYRPMGDSV